jgi:hypothetical protein
MIDHLQQLDRNHHQIQHPDCSRGSLKVTPPKKEQCTSTIVVQSKVVGFHFGGNPNFPSNAFNKNAIGRYNQ